MKKYKTHYYCDGCGEEIMSSYAYKHSGKLYCTKECVFECLGVNFVWLEEDF